MDELVRRLQPGIMVNDRGWGNKATCDYSTPERDYEWDLANGRHIESCDSVGVQSWGYRADEDYHTHGYLTRNIDRYLSTGANFLLNVGPKADGTIPDEARAIMADVGKWYGKVRDSFRNVKTVSGLKFKIARVLSVHFGGDMRFFTSYYAPEYVPQLSQFAVQQNEAVKTKVGNYPLINVYANFKLKKARFFIMYSHANKGLVGGDNYFSIPHYPLNPGRFQFGVSVDFVN